MGGLLDRSCGAPAQPAAGGDGHAAPKRADATAVAVGAIVRRGAPMAMAARIASRRAARRPRALAPISCAAAVDLAHGGLDALVRAQAQQRRSGLAWTTAPFSER